MAEQHPSVDETEQVEGHVGPRFSVRATRAARKEGYKLFSPEALAWIVDQLRLLEFWPLGPGSEFAADLNVEKMEHKGETFYEYRLENRSVGVRNLRAFFWVQDDARTIWVVFAYPKKTRQLEKCIKDKVARRVRNARSAIQDGIDP